MHQHSMYHTFWQRFAPNYYDPKKKKKNLKNIGYKVGGEIFCHFLYVHNVFSTKSQITALIKISSLKT